MFGTIVVASNGSETADRALATGECLAREGGCRVVVAHVIEVIRRRGFAYPINPAEEWLLTKLRLQVAGMQAAGIDAELETRTTSAEPARLLADIVVQPREEMVAPWRR